MPNLGVVIDTSGPRDYGGGSKSDLAQLQRVRTAKGVKSFTRIVNENEAGMRAVVYDDDTEFTRLFGKLEPEERYIDKGGLLGDQDSPRSLKEVLAFQALKRFFHQTKGSLALMVDEHLGGPSERTIRSSSSTPLHEWNTTCPISKLPLELISYITALNLPETYSARHRTKVLYSTRMVSRLWRSAIDSTPSLWNVVSSYLPLHVNATVIQRSGRCPLHVYINWPASASPQAPDPGSTELAELAVKEIERWSTAILRLPPPDATSPYLTSPAPLLRSLRVRSKSWNDPTVPIALFGGIAPRLETLQVNRVLMDWTSSFIHGLRELDLSNMNEGQLSTQQVLDILTSTTLLEKLRIFNSILVHDLQPFQTTRAIIQLARLTTINLNGVNEDATTIILLSIRAPNCNILRVINWEDDMDNPTRFPEPALAHFKDFQRRTLSANPKSHINFFDGGMQWESRSGGQGGLHFDLDIRYSAPAIGVEWATRVIGIGVEELIHDMEVVICHERLADDDFALYHSMSRCQSVTKLVVQYDHALPRPITELLGSWKDSEDGTRPFPSLPRLEILVLISSQASWLDDLEVLVNRRFGGREDVIGEQVSSLSITLDMWGSYAGPSLRADLARVQRLRAAKGVQSITRISTTCMTGMLAAVYDDDAEL
ncbi:hypothetical protein FS837_003082 [Tulasnella sp. UAMH 9824]|nr:hypothetical protein FS837_003082 [Tulasnella sp. UAMH 9824]